MNNIDKVVANEIARANQVRVSQLGLRFDKVVTRLFDNIRLAIAQKIPNNIAVLITITAPIKLPAKTEYVLIRKINDLLTSEIQNQDTVVTILQNNLRVRFVKPTSNQTIKFVGLVHNPSIDSKVLLRLATQWLTGSSSTEVEKKQTNDK